MAIGESLGDSIQRGRGMGGRGYLDKFITHKHQGKEFLFYHFGKPYGMYCSTFKVFKPLSIVCSSASI